MDAKVERLKQVAQSGDIGDFYTLIQEDVKLLEHIDELPFIDTPLHIVAFAGHIPFALKLMGLKPSFAHKLNPDGFSPIHLALKNGHIELVHQLLEIDLDLARVKGKECITPLHYVVETGDCHIDLLDKFLLVSPNSIADVTVRDETALHIALKKEQLEAFKFLVGWLGRNLFNNTSLNVFSILNQKNVEGNTVLHIVVSQNEAQAVCHLLTWGSRSVDVNSTNLEGKTAWDISQGQTQVKNREIKLMLHSAGASSGSSLSTITRSDDNNIDEFYNLIGEDEELLEHIDKLPFVNTPLHIAASHGNIQFALEVLSLKPSFARKLNQNGFSPVHLALQNEHIELVRRLVLFDGDLIRVKGRKHLTPLHYIVESGKHLNLLEEFLLFCPNSITDVTVQNETALHIALKYNRLEAFKFFVGWLANNFLENDQIKNCKVLNWQDNEGNTVLHSLVSKNETQAVRHLLSWCKGFVKVNRRRMRFVDVNRKNLEDKTAWDMLQEGNREIRVMLLSAGAKPGSSLSTFNRYPNPEYQKLSTYTSSYMEIRRDIWRFATEWRNILLVVAALLVTLSFQAVLTPPGGVWQDNGLCIAIKPGSSFKSVGNSNYPKIIHLRNGTKLVCEHKAGTAIALEHGLFFLLFLVCNTMLFSLSTSIIVLLIQNLALFLLLSIILCSSYFYSVWTITDSPYMRIPLGIVLVTYFAFIQLLSFFHKLKE